MKVWLGGRASPNSGGMYRVHSGLYEYLPQYDIEVVDNPEDADILNPHIGIWDKIPDDKPVVVSSHGMLWADDNWGEKLKIKSVVESLSAYRRAEVVTTPSRFVARAIARYTGANPLIAHHGIDTDSWIPGENKGYVLWNKARADIVSDPAEMNRLASLATDTMFYSTYGQEAENVYISGRVFPDDMHDLVSSAEVYLALSKESGGPCFGVLEALSCGVPVLSWNFGGTAEVIRHRETGYLAEPGNYEDLLAGLRYCQEYRNYLSEDARQDAIDHYQWKDTILDYIRAYEQALYGWNDIVSVIVPCYNLGKFLPHCLNSVIEQTYPHLEIVVIDDASTDNSWEIIQEYGQKDSRIIPIRHHRNMHVSQARNTGIRVSTGTFILPLDADDSLYGNSVEVLVNTLRNNRNIDVVAGHLHIYHESDLDGPYQTGGWPNNAELKLQLEGHNRLPYASMYRRKVFDRVGGYRTRIRNGVEDADFWTRALSLGYKAEIIDDYTLRYTKREVSLGGVNDKGSQAWLSWFPYKEANSPARATEVNNFCPPKVSVVIPVGPGHAPYIQSCLDSLWAQTEFDWEAVVVNDTGEVLEDIPGYVNYVTYTGNHGVAYARNRGIEAALADKIIFLDVDDTLQPHALQSLLAAHDYAGGWIYGDWYTNNGEKVEYAESKSWDYDLLLQQSLGPITGIYEKEHVKLVSGFTEDIPGWEDWDFHLKLLHHGICGTRLKTALITYNMHLGWRRENNFRDKENLLQYIHEKHYKLLKDNKMACSSCGGKKTLTISQKAQQAPVLDDLVKLQYLGGSAGRIRIDSKTHKGTNYIFSASRPEVYVFKSDVDRLLAFRLPGGKTEMFKVLETPTQATPADIVVQEEPLVSQDMPVAFPVPLEHLSLEEHVINKLRKGGLETIADIMEAEDTDLLSVKGIGEQRVEEIREAVNVWLSNS